MEYKLIFICLHDNNGTFLKDRGPVNLDNSTIIFILLAVAHVEWSDTFVHLSAIISREIRNKTGNGNCWKARMHALTAVSTRYAPAITSRSYQRAELFCIN